MAKDWKVLGQQVLLERAPWLRVWVERVRLPNGVVIDDYFRLSLRSWVSVFAVTVDGRVPMVEQYRRGVDGHTLELPAGYLEDDEPVTAAAQRELREEVGCEAGHMEELGQYYVLPERSDMRMHLVLAHDARLVGDQQLEDTEEITVRWLTLAELRAALRNGAIISSSHAIAVAQALDALEVR